MAPKSKKPDSGYPMAPMLADGTFVRARCACPVMAWFIEPRKVGKKCPLGCGAKYRLLPNEPFERQT